MIYLLVLKITLPSFDFDGIFKVCQLVCVRESGVLRKIDAILVLSKRVK